MKDEKFFYEFLLYNEVEELKNIIEKTGKIIGKSL